MLYNYDSMQRYKSILGVIETYLYERSMNLVREFNLLIIMCVKKSLIKITVNRLIIIQFSFALASCIQCYIII